MHNIREEKRLQKVSHLRFVDARLYCCPEFSGLSATKQQNQRIWASGKAKHVADTYGWLECSKAKGHTVV